MLIGDYLKRERKIKKITILDLASKSGVSKSYISQIERNEACPFDAISKMLDALGLTVSDANAAGVNWWAGASSASDDDLEVIIDWLKSQSQELVHSIRLVIDELKNGG